MKLAPSILSADFTRLREQVQRAEDAGADYIHVDVMDGRFVPNITVGPLIVEAVRRSTTLPLDVHLMVVEPERVAADFIHAGASILTVHQEACVHLHATVAKIHELGARAGVALCPATPVGSMDDIMADIDLLLIMLVNPGFGGQKLIPSSVQKIRRARELLAQTGSAAELEVDGGVNVDTAGPVVAAGATVLVAGSAIFGDDSIEANVSALRSAVTPVGMI